MEELLDNLLFSVTLPLVAFPDPGRPPSRAERLVHNGARRRLAERYGSEEYRALAERATERYLWSRFSMPGLMVAGALILSAMFRRPKSN